MLSSKCVQNWHSAKLMHMSSDSLYYPYEPDWGLKDYSRFCGIMLISPTTKNKFDSSLVFFKNTKRRLGCNGSEWGMLSIELNLSWTHNIRLNLTVDLEPWPWDVTVSVWFSPHLGAGLTLSARLESWNPHHQLTLSQHHCEKCFRLFVFFFWK